MDNCVFLQIAPKMVYSGTFLLLRKLISKFGIQVTYVDGTDPSKYREAVLPNTKVCLKFCFTIIEIE